MQEKIIIVGGGTAGLVSALVLKTRFPQKSIEIIKSDNIGIIGVGEGTTEHWNHFMQMVGIDYRTLVKETDATFKYGVMFDGWKDRPFLHSIPDDVNNLRIGQYLSGYGFLIGNKKSIEHLNPIGAWEGKLDLDRSIYQFHFNTHKLNDFLLKLCVDRGITIHTDDITDVSVSNNKITSIKSKNNNYTADFFIDCTGFKKLLISKLGSQWQSYSKWLKVNEAIAFQTPDTDEYNPYTLAKAMDYGWMWRIPVWGRWGNGYVFDNNFISADQAKQEVEKLLGIKINVAKNIQFDPGRLEKSWIGNCVAIGLSSNFVEPLEATSIGSAIQQTFLLMHYISNYDESSVNQYNKKVNLVLDNVRDFIILHYLNNSDKTEFWKKVNNINVPVSLQEKLKRWKHNLPIKEDVADSEYILFFEQNWTNILYGLDHFDTDSIYNEYCALNIEYRKHTEQALSNIYSNNIQSHKQYLEKIRND